MNLQTTFRLNNDVEMPALGLGVWKATPEQTHRAVTWALEAGYRHIDTAAIYGNEEAVGQAIRDSNVGRERVFVTTKLWRDDHGLDSAPRAFQQSMERLGMEQVDLYLSHFPTPGKRLDAWRAMEGILGAGKARAIGVSNYTVRHLQELIRETRIIPAVNQVEFHPFLFQTELLEFCREHRIQLEAYSPLTHGLKLEDPTLRKIATTHGKSPAQVLIRWCLEHKVVVIPKSTSENRIAENAHVFDFQLSEEERATLDGLNENLRTCWDPSDTP